MAQITMNITPDKVAHVIIRAREYDAKVDPWDGGDNSDTDGEAILENRRDDPIATELAEFIDGLNDDEQTALVAVTWIGRGTYQPEDFAEAVATATTEKVNKTSAYLLGIPLLADYLEEGLESLGYSVEDAENKIL